LSLQSLVIDANPEDVYRAEYPRLVGIVFRITGDRGQAEELASEALFRLIARPQLFRPTENLSGWLYRTAMNLGLNALKARTRRTKYENAASIETVRTETLLDPLNEILRAEEQHKVRRVLKTLKNTDAQLLLLRHGGFSYQEMAEVLEINPASVGKQLSRAMVEFEKKYTAWYGGTR